MRLPLLSCMSRPDGVCIHDDVVQPCTLGDMTAACLVLEPVHCICINTSSTSVMIRVFQQELLCCAALKVIPTWSTLSASKPCIALVLQHAILECGCAGFIGDGNAGGSESEQAQALAKLLYRATLQTLPASARSWFTDIKDKRLAAALEVSLDTSQKLLHMPHFVLACWNLGPLGSRRVCVKLGRVQWSMKYLSSWPRSLYRASGPACLMSMRMRFPACKM